MVQQQLDSSDFHATTQKVGQVTAAVNHVKNGLNTNDQHLRANHIKTIFELYAELTTLVQAYGQMVAHDLKEFDQVGVNIQQTDEDAK